MLFEYISQRMKSNSSQVISDGITTFTYAEVLDKAKELGNTLTKDIYAILCSSELKTAISLLACLYSKKVALPLSSKYGLHHYEKIIDHIHPEGIITDNGVTLNNCNVDRSLDKVAVIMCSSGTTGLPKGIMLSEENILTNLQDIEKYMPVDNSDHMLISRPIYHCAVMTSELLYGLIRGAKIQFYNDSLNPKKLLRIIDEADITVTSSTPTVFYYLCKYINASRLNCNLKTIAISGECMTENVAAEIIKALPNTMIYNVYGLTEASPRVSYLPCELFRQNPTSVGIPLASVKVRTEENELCVKANSVMLGYYNDITNSQLVLTNGWLHTGDIAEIINGLIYIKCRKDNMIIRAGMNIYPQEIENALKQDARIHDVLAYSNKDETVGEKLIFKVIAPNMTKSNIFKLCKELLSSYQYPDSIIIVDHFDYTPSGKVIRHI